MENKIIFNKEVLQKAIETAKKVVKSRPVVPILENYLLLVEPDKVSIIAGDLQNYIEVELDGGYEMRPQTKFEVLLTPDTLTFLKKMELQPLTLAAFEEFEESYPKWTKDFEGVQIRENFYFFGGSQQERDKFLTEFDRLIRRSQARLEDEMITKEEHENNVLLTNAARAEFEALTMQTISKGFVYTIQDDEGEAKYSSDDAQDFPKVPETSEDMYIFAPEEIGELKGLADYMSKDETRPAMCGIHLGYNEGKLNLVATDGHVLKVVNLPAWDEAERHEQLAIIPRECVRILNLLIKPTHAVTIRKASNEHGDIQNLSFSFENVKVTCRNIDERYPDYWNVIPNESSTQLSFEVKPFVKLLDKTAMFANKTTKQIRLGINGSLKLTAEDLDLSKEYSGVFTGSYEGKELEIGFNADYLRKVVLGFGDNVTLEMREANRAAVIREGNTLALVMPVMLSQY